MQRDVVWLQAALSEYVRAGDPRTRDSFSQVNRTQDEQKPERRCNIGNTRTSIRYARV